MDIGCLTVSKSIILIILDNIVRLTCPFPDWINGIYRHVKYCGNHQRQYTKSPTCKIVRNMGDWLKKNCKNNQFYYTPYNWIMAMLRNKIPLPCVWVLCVLRNICRLAYLKFI